MVVSSRTPEGTPNRCPVCGSEVLIEPSGPFGDAPCPRCGALLWFLALPDAIRLFEEEAARNFQEATRGIVAKYFAVSEDRAWREEIGADSLDLVELVMELEAELGSDWDDPERWR